MHRLPQLVAERLELRTRGGAHVEVAQRREADLEHPPAGAVGLRDRVLADEALRQQRRQHAVRRRARHAELLGRRRDADRPSLGDERQQPQRAADGFDRVGGSVAFDAATVPAADPRPAGRWRGPPHRVPGCPATCTLTLACSDYDRTRALRDGRVTADGVELNYLPLKIEETFFRMLRHREFDVAEMSMSSYVVSLVSDDPWLVAIPVYPSRSFRHAHVAVRRDRITEPVRPPREGRRHAGVPAHRVRLGPRHPGRPPRRAGGERALTGRPASRRRTARRSSS